MFLSTQMLAVDLGGGSCSLYTPCAGLQVYRHHEEAIPGQAIQIQPPSQILLDPSVNIRRVWNISYIGPNEHPLEGSNADRTSVSACRCGRGALFQAEGMEGFFFSKFDVQPFGGVSGNWGRCLKLKIIFKHNKTHCKTFENFSPRFGGCEPRNTDYFELRFGRVEG